ncbi:MAG: metalloregulator ArsR/SmtB family transcription factor [Deltaproteobacteria bacterium]|nr:metalloregulator ArsR/SmtB family transcription factor [Deltaproteobacteria bacterium]
MNRKSIKARLYKELSRIGRALGSPARLELLEILAQGERSVEMLARQTRLSVANTSHHLQALREARLVEARRQGVFVHYRLTSPEVFGVVQMIRRLGEEHIAEVDRIVRSYFGQRDALEPISREELLERAKAGTVVVLDVRPAEEYRAGHIAGAISVPVDRLEDRLADLPADREIIAYCRGPYCVMSYAAVEKLRARGRRARRLVDGFPEWRAQGLPTSPRGGAA